jgi:4a-hydroxytetrahydrobiopterin dehydratase
MSLLSTEQISERLKQLAGWERDGEAAIVSERELADFAAALEYVNRVGELAEAANHHPDILLHSWNRVRLTLSTHSEGGLTAADFELAGRVAGLA